MELKDMPKRERYDRQMSAMELERSSFIPHYRELSEFIRPRRGRFFEQDRNKGDRRYNSIINSKATQAHRIAEAGLFAGVASPSRPWFSTETEDPELMEYGPVKEYLYKQDRLLRAIFSSSNFYNMLPVLLGELILFGTGAMTHVDDFNDVARFYTHTAGSYVIGQNDRYEVDRFGRKIMLTVSQIMEKFGERGGGAKNTNISAAVRDQYSKGNYHSWYPVCQFIEPNEKFDGTRLEAKFKPYKSVYWEPGNRDKDQLLKESGFDEFPVYVPRWSVTGEDIYGTDCPAMTALGDIQGLQVQERRKAQAIDKMVSPPLHGPPTVRNVPVANLAGGLTIYDGGNERGLEPIYTVDPRLGELRQDMDAVERRIDTAFYVDLFLAITNMEGIQPKNQLELSQRNQERLLQLGPPLERLHGELLDMVIDRQFNQALRAGILPPIPDELGGQELKIRYVSSLAQAQRSVVTGGIERTAAFVTGLSELFPQARDKFNVDQAIDEYAQANGAVPTIVRSDDEVETIRAEAAQREAQLQQMQMAGAASEMAKNVGNIDLEGDNPVSRVVDGIQKARGQ